MSFKANIFVLIFYIDYLYGWASLVAKLGKNLPAMQETWVRFLGEDPGEGKGKPLQYSCLENPMDRGAWWATVHGVTTVLGVATVHGVAGRRSRTQLND